jgi:predicted MFS family arabinose efflux permease
VGDQIPENRRGAATGILMSSFSMASILGVPLGLGLAALSTWHLPFLILGFSSLAIALAAGFLLPGMRGHLNHHRALSPIKNFVSILQTANLRWALAMIFCLMFAGFSVIPFLSPSLVFNAGMKEAQLPLLYFFGGAFTLFSSRWIGGLADRYGKPKIFRIFGLISIVPILIITNLHVTPLPIILLCTTFFMVVVTGRVIPAMALALPTLTNFQLTRSVSEMKVQVMSALSHAQLNVTVQADGVPVPSVTTNALSFPAMVGEVPQEDTDSGDPLTVPPTFMCPLSAISRTLFAVTFVPSVEPIR